MGILGEVEDDDRGGVLVQRDRDSKETTSCEIDMLERGRSISEQVLFSGRLGGGQVGVTENEAKEEGEIVTTKVLEVVRLVVSSLFKASSEDIDRLFELAEYSLYNDVSTGQ